MSEWIIVRNPANGEIGEVSRESYDEVWKDKGYELVSESGHVTPAMKDPAHRSPDAVGETAEAQQTPPEGAEAEGEDKPQSEDKPARSKKKS